MKILISPHTDPVLALQRTTHLCIAAHPDDIEMLAAPAIAECYAARDKWFCGVVLTDGAGSPRTGRYARCSDERMVKIRAAEQARAAEMGRYTAICLGEFTSEQVKGADDGVIEALLRVLRKCQPQQVIIHNLADKHPTHVAASLRALEALRALPPAERPDRLYMGEVWRSLDWLCDEDKTVLNDKMPALAGRQLRCFASQVAGGKRYDRGFVGRLRANATFLESHQVDKVKACTYAIDATPLLINETADPLLFIMDKIAAFGEAVAEQLESLQN